MMALPPPSARLARCRELSERATPCRVGLPDQIFVFRFVEDLPASAEDLRALWPSAGIARPSPGPMIIHSPALAGRGASIKRSSGIGHLRTRTPAASQTALAPAPAGPLIPT